MIDIPDLEIEERADFQNKSQLGVLIIPLDCPCNGLFSHCATKLYETVPVTFTRWPDNLVEENFAPRAAATAAACNNG
jgi:hypothetical protein